MSKHITITFTTGFFLEPITHQHILTWEELKRNSEPTQRQRGQQKKRTTHSRKSFGREAKRHALHANT